MGELKEKDRVEPAIVKLKNSWKNHYKARAISDRHALLKATFHAFKGNL